MNVYEAKLQYKAVGIIEANPTDTPERAVAYLGNCFDEYREQESFWMIGLNRKNYPKFRSMISLGTLSGTIVHPREVFKPAIIGSCSAVIVAHNHPSGDPNPSSADIKITRILKSAAQILDIDLLDHLVVGEEGSFYSFADEGLL